MSSSNRRPRIPETWLPSSEQQLYALAILGASQVYKLTDAMALSLRALDPVVRAANAPASTATQLMIQYEYLTGHLPRQGSMASTYLIKWSILDATLLIIVGWLHIPGRLQSRLRLAKCILPLLFINSILFGQIKLGTVLLTALGWTWRFLMGTTDNVQTLTERSVQPTKIIAESEHLLGHRSVRLSPNGNAVFNPTGATFCLEKAGAGQVVYIPILVNNTSPTTIQYAIRPLDRPAAPYQSTSVKASKLVRPKRHEIEKAYQRRKWYQDEETRFEEGLLLSDAVSTTKGIPQPFTIHDRTAKETKSVRSGDKISAMPPTIGSTETLYYLPISETGLVDLLRIQDRDDYDFRIRSSAPVVIAECPSQGHFVVDDAEADPKRTRKTAAVALRCVGDADLKTIRIRGVSPMTVRWTTQTDGKAQPQHVIRDIEGDMTGLDPDASHDNASQGPGSGQDQHGPNGSLRRLAPAKVNAVTHEQDVSLSFSHAFPGAHEIQILAIEDGLGNVHRPDVKGAKLVYQVQELPTAHFSPTSLPRGVDHLALKQNSTVSLFISATKDRHAQDLTVEIQYAPEPGTKHVANTRRIEVTGNPYEHIVAEPGTYSIHRVTAGICQGLVKGMTSLTVREVPPPTARVEYTAERDCAGETGFTAHLEFVGGAPPYTVHYRSYRRGDSPQDHIKTRIYQARDDIVIRPDRPGKYVFEPLSISDSNYPNIRVPLASFEQTIHPQAEFHLDPVHGEGLHRKDIWTCQTNQSDINFILKGLPPFTVECSLIWLDRTEIVNQTFDTAGKAQISIVTPADLVREGGRFSVSLTRVWDRHGCMIALPDHNLSFEVRTTRPTAQFDESSGTSLYTIVEGSTAEVPLHLTGTPPWSVVYQYNGDTMPKYHTKQQDSSLNLQGAGKYKITEVRDRHCIGWVPSSNAEIEVQYIARPQIRLSSASLSSAASLDRQTVCSGEQRATDLALQGHPPFRYRYRHIHKREGHKTVHKVQERQALESQTRLHLSSEPGRHTYEIVEVADRSYDFPNRDDAKKPRIILEHTVVDRPTAKIRSTAAATFCLNDSLTRSRSSAQIEFKGQVPFGVTLRVRDTKRGHEEILETSNIKRKDWDLTLPYTFREAGNYEIKIVSVTDASGCVWDPPEADELSIHVDVVEPASIKAISSGADYCVGDTLDYLLQGTRPWTLGYTFGGKKHRIETDRPEFSRLADRPGIFEITSVSHRKAAHCETRVEGMTTVIHPLPSAHIQEGDSWLHEGDLVDIEITFKGTPPFAFTYSRSIFVGKKLVIEETETIADIQGSRYVLQSARQGEYDIIAVSDQYCRVGASESQTKRKNLQG